MTGDQIASLAYLGLLFAVIGGWFFVQNRQSLGKMLQMGILWGLIFLGVIAARGLWDDVRTSTNPFQAVSQEGFMTLPRDRDGHFYAVLDLNGVPVEFMVDTGATQVVLNYDDAKRIGLDPDSLPFLGRAETANGAIEIAFDTVDNMSFGPYVDENVRVSVSRADMGTSLLGMSYLSRFDTLQISGSQMLMGRDPN